MMGLEEARAVLEGALPRSIERARRLLRRSGCDIDGEGRVLLEGPDGAARYSIMPDPLAEAGMRLAEEARP